MPTVAAPRHHKRRNTKKLKSSFAGRTTSTQGAHTSPPASSSSNTRANLPELFALFTMQQEADQDERQRDDSEDPTEPSVSPASRWTSDDEFGKEAEGHMRSSAALPTPGSVGPSGRQVFGGVAPEVVAGRGKRSSRTGSPGVEGSHGLQRCRRSWKARGVCRREGRARRRRSTCLESLRAGSVSGSDSSLLSHVESLRGLAARTS
ncbi:hypothetical protein MTO96_051608 [Rhipicephalus appendiculatus]